jgi:ABC-type Fe3+ transport system substrate-binding protein
MSYTPRLNWFLFSLYLILVIGVLIVSLLVPQVRAVAYAPLRELLVPPPSPVVVPVLYSTEKEAWLNEVAARFEATNPTVDGRPVKLTMSQMGSREIYLAVLSGDAQPVIISPASSLQISILKDLSTSKTGRSVIDSTDPEICRSVFETPVVLVAWKERAAALWNGRPGSDLWDQLYTALTNSQGWAAYGHPDWGYVKFGHTSPLKSNSGFQTILLMTYAYHHKTSGLTTNDILGDTAYQSWFTSFEQTISTFGDSTGTYMQDMIAYGPSTYDVVAVYEATAVEQVVNAQGRYGEIQVYYPPATHLSDHPFCILDGDWVTPEQARAARLFIDYLEGREAQQLALLSYGFRPADPGIPLDQAGSPFERYAANGLRIDLPPEVELPPGNVLNTLLDFWTRHVQP